MTAPAMDRAAKAREEARQVLQHWLDETPRYEGDDPRAVHYRRNVRALETALAALSPPSDEAWEDIASAPKDGTRVLLAEDGGETVYAGAWVAEYESWASYCGQYVTVTPDPTYWRPLPAPPASGEG